MFGSNIPLHHQLNNSAHKRLPQQLRRQAVQLFWRVYVRAQLTSFWGGLRRQDNSLRRLQQKRTNTNEKRQPGIHTVAIQEIQGSEGRCADFDNHFQPRQAHLQDRWVNMAVAFEKGINLPPVELIYSHHQYYVRDGHHRISVARARGQLTIDAVVNVR